MASGYQSETRNHGGLHCALRCLLSQPYTHLRFLPLIPTCEIQVNTGPLGESDYGNSDSFDPTPTPTPTPRPEGAPVQTTGLAAVPRSNKEKDENDCSESQDCELRTNSHAYMSSRSPIIWCIFLHDLSMTNVGRCDSPYTDSPSPKQASAAPVCVLW